MSPILHTVLCSCLCLPAYSLSISITIVLSWLMSFYQKQYNLKILPFQCNTQFSHKSLLFSRAPLNRTSASDLEGFSEDRWALSGVFWPRALELSNTWHKQSSRQQTPAACRTRPAFDSINSHLNTAFFLPFFPQLY